MGFFLGKYIYIMDAYEDLPEDIEKGRYNPLKDIYGKEDYEVVSYTHLDVYKRQDYKR